MGVFRLELLDGAMEVVAFPDAFREYGVHLQDAAPVMVCGESCKRTTRLRIKAQEIYPLKDMHKIFAERLSVHVPAASLDDAKLWKIKEMLRGIPARRP